MNPRDPRTACTSTRAAIRSSSARRSLIVFVLIVASSLSATACRQGDRDARLGDPSVQDGADVIGGDDALDDAPADLGTLDVRGGSGDATGGGPTGGGAGEEPPPEDPVSVEDGMRESGRLAVANAADLDVLADESCADLAATTVAGHQELLDALGSAGPDDTYAVDLAFESTMADPRLVTMRADEIGCDAARLRTELCRRLPDLRPQGAVGRDLVAALAGGCPS